MIQGLISTILVAAQFILACPLVQCSGSDGHVQVEVAHLVCCESVATESKTNSQEFSTLEPQPCTDTPIQLREWTTNKSSGNRKELRLVKFTTVDPLLIAVIRSQSVVWRPKVAVVCSDVHLRTLRTVILTV